MLEVKVNKSKTYILPLVVNEVDLRFTDIIDTTYLYRNDKSFDYPIINIMFNLKYLDEKKIVEFLNYLTRISSNKYFIENVTIGDEYEMLTLKIHDNALDAYQNFIKGKFSLFSETDKQLILRYLYLNSHPVNHTMVKQILYKDKDLKKKIEKRLNVELNNSVELSSKPDKESETINII